jgi:mobilome CxxCx(11)CxxC protein
MLDAKTRQRIEEERFKCLCAEYLHIRSLKKLNNKIRLVDALALIVPVLYFPFRYFSKDTSYAFGVEVIWEFFAACLIAAAIWKFVAGWQDRFKNHGKLLGENIALVRQAVDLLNDERATLDSAQSFLALAEKSEMADRELLLQPKPSERQDAYREALRELGGAHATCPVCSASAWKFTKGSCEACGNTPRANATN